MLPFLRSASQPHLIQSDTSLLRRVGSNSSKPVHLPPHNPRPHQAPNCPPSQAQIIPPVPPRHPLVQVALERHPLHVLICAQFHQRLAPGVAPVEHLLQQAQEPEHAPVLLVPFPQVLRLEVGFGHHPPLLPRPHDGLPAHPPRLGGEVNPLAGAPGDRRPPHHPSRPRVLRDRVRLHPDHLPAGYLGPGPGPDRGLKPLDVGLGGGGAGADGHVVAFGEDPGVEIWGDVGADVHLGEVLVAGHASRGEPDPLLESDSGGVIAGGDGAGDAAVGAVGADDDIDGEGGGGAGEGAGGGGGGGVVDEAEGGEETGEQAGAGVGGAAAEESVEDLAAEHGDVLVGPEGAAEVGGAVGGGENAHAGDAAVNEGRREVELGQHAEGDGAAAGLRSRGGPLDEVGLDASEREGLGGRGAGGAAANDGRPEGAGGACDDDGGLGKGRRSCFGGGGAGGSEGEAGGEWGGEKVVARGSHRWRSGE
ncbi:unnamed protein product [Musa textilis]